MDPHAQWWQGAVIYHIYPRSFLDTTGDGVGDLQGIASKLDYVAELGVDAIWISPFVRSPMRDFGYDVSDYRDVDPLFGTLEDFRDLLRGAHERGLKVLMDQVLSHTSNEHPWFLESRSSRDNPRADWHVWADPREDGSPPNNWLSVFGGSAWQWEPRRSQYYLHNFLREQPDLNFHTPAVQEAMLDVCRHWLDMGVDGFRLDVCAFYFHDPELRDNPPNPVRPTGRSFMFNPYSMQRHLHDIGQPENLAFLEKLRALCDAQEAALLGELHETEAAKLHRDYTAPGRLHLAYGYWLLGAETISAADVVAVARSLGHAEADGWPAWALENHDFIRAPTRLGRDRAPLGLMAALICLRGAFCLYQGAELGLPEAEVPYDRLVDPYGREFHPAFSGRDGARTPMPWNGDDEHCGFSDHEPWLPIPPAHRALNVEDQSHRAGSTLNRMRRFLGWRRSRPELRGGALEFLEHPEPVLVFRRRRGERALLCAFNLGDEDAVVDLPAAALGEPATGHGLDWSMDGGRLTLPGDGGYFGVVT
jgi:alpha-glucosidase